MPRNNDEWIDPATNLPWEVVDQMDAEEYELALEGAQQTPLLGGPDTEFHGGKEMKDYGLGSSSTTTLGHTTGLGGGGNQWKSKSSKGFVSCHSTHKPMPLKGGHKVWGSSAATPNVSDADVYVGLDSNMAGDSSLLPWTKPVGILFRITDMSTPKGDDVEHFRKLIDYLEKAIRKGKKVHVGCIGGHGRTGMVLAALVKQMDGEEDAITYVRKHYCDKAVETKSQIDFLHENYGIKKVDATKGTVLGSSVVGGSTHAKSGRKLKASEFEARPMDSSLVIWNG